jgi:hypothetical protein
VQADFVRRFGCLKSDLVNKWINMESHEAIEELNEHGLTVKMTRSENIQTLVQYLYQCEANTRTGAEKYLIRLTNTKDRKMLEREENTTDGGEALLDRKTLAAVEAKPIYLESLKEIKGSSSLFKGLGKTYKLDSEEFDLRWEHDSLEEEMTPVTNTSPDLGKGLESVQDLIFDAKNDFLAGQRNYPR